MSIFLIPEYQALASLQKFIIPSHKISPFLNDQTTLQQEEQKINSDLKKNKNLTILSISSYPTQKQYSILLNQICDKFKGILELKLTKTTETLSIKLDILNNNDYYYKINNRYEIIQTCRNICHRTNSFQNNPLPIRIAINMTTGQISMQLPFFNIFGSTLLSSMTGNPTQNKMLLVFSDIISNYIPIIESEFSNIVREDKTAYENKAIENIHRYNDMLMVSSQISERHIQTEKEARENEKKMKLSVQKLVSCKLKIEPILTKNITLMSYHRQLNFSSKDYNISTDELRFIRSMIAMPVIPKSGNPYQIDTILNQIFVYQNGSPEMNKISKGGFATIFLTKIRYWYINHSQNLKKQQPNPRSTKNMLQKCVVIKKQYEHQIEKTKWHSRNQHQMKIIAQLQNGNSPFLPKYYILINNPNPFGEETIVMDYIPSSNLNEYQHSNHLSLSLLSKLYLMFSITQAVRYLRDYQIVHLDLKPNNIMISSNMLVKLIDFGESYHPEVCKGRHRPGFTIPYSCPEIFSDQTQHFTNKNDVFSIGVIFYELLYGRYPFDINKNTTLIDQGMEHYLSYWLFTPEQFQNYGDITILRILNGLISKCLAKQPQQRPELDWMALIIRQCIQIIH